MSDTRFAACLEQVLAHEGGYVDHPSDPGGATNMGITHKTLARWRHVSPWWALPKSAVMALGKDEAARIYRARYWTPCRADQMPAGLDLALFDFAVNSGPDRAIRTLQAGLGVVADGVVGPLTLAAAEKASTSNAINDLCDRRLGFLGRLSGFSTFGRGWTRRVAAIRQAALAMAPAAAPSLSQRRIIMDVLTGYKTYIVAGFMLLAGLAQLLGIELPALEGSAAGNLVLEALAIIFLRKGLKGDIGRA